MSFRNYFKYNVCSLVCGLSLVPATLTPLVLHGTPTNKGEFPWLAAVYLRRKPGDAEPGGGTWSQQCGGTLISPHIVLTGKETTSTLHYL